MNAALYGVISFACVLAGTIIGLVLRRILPGHHLSDDSKDTVKMGTGLVATICALVLGLLVSSAKHTFDTMNSEIMQSSTKLILLDRILVRYGQETEPLRRIVRGSITTLLKNWTENKTLRTKMDALETAPTFMEQVYDKLMELTPQNDSQQALRSDALQICKDLQQTRWFVIEQDQMSLPPVLFAVMLFWLVILFISIGLFAPPNKTVLVVLFVCAVSVGGAVFLIEELDKPLDGMVQVSKAPLLKAVELMSR